MNMARARRRWAKALRLVMRLDKLGSDPCYGGYGWDIKPVPAIYRASVEQHVSRRRFTRKDAR